MQQHRNNIHDSAPLRRLMDEQMRVLEPALQRCFGSHALLLDAATGLGVPVLPMMGHWTVLRVTGGCHTGDVQAALDEPLPFVDEAFELVFLRHALEAVTYAPELLGEAIRVLAPGGTLVLTGVHPVSGWAPWFYWHTRGSRRVLWMPLRLARELHHAGLDMEQVMRTGRLWPGMAAEKPASPSALGGGYVLIARRRNRKVTPLRVRATPIRVSANSRLSPGIRRSAVS